MMDFKQYGTPITLYKLLDDTPELDETLTTEVSTLKQVVTEDLSQLLNTQPTEILSDCQDESLIESSVLNYGLGITIGESISSSHYPKVEAAIRATIIRFEPRIDPHHLTVTVLPVMTRSQSISQLSLSISAKLLSYPENIPLNLAGTYDIGTAKAIFKS